MPLGIELAAGWVDVLSLEHIAHEIQQGIDILETDMRDVPERHRSLRATFERTWNRLAEEQQAIFARFSVFRGGFTREAAEAIAGANIRHLHKLAQKSLIQPETNERYHIHELLRQFAGKKLAETDEHTIIQEKHALFFADFMAERDHDMRNKRQIEALKLIDPDFENVRLAWQYIVSRQEWDQVPKFLHSLWFYLDLRARSGSAAELLEPTVKLLQTIPSTETTELTLGRVLARLSWFTNDIGSMEMATTLCDEALRILRRHDSPEDLLWTLRTRALLAWMENHSDLMLKFSQEGLATAQLIGEKAWEGGFLIWLGSARIYTDSELALQLCEEGVALVEACEEHHGLMSGIHALSIIKELQNDYEQAAYWNDRLRLLTQSLGHIFLNARSYVAQGRILLAQKDHAGARTNLGKGLQLYWDAGYGWFIAFPLTYIVQLLAEQRELERAVELRAAIDKQLVGLEQSDAVAQALYHQLKTQMEPACFEEAWSRGVKRDLGNLVHELLADLNDG
jgi:hypothetical protein